MLLSLVGMEQSRVECATAKLQTTQGYDPSVKLVYPLRASIIKLRNVKSVSQTTKQHNRPNSTTTMCLAIDIQFYRAIIYGVWG